MSRRSELVAGLSLGAAAAIAALVVSLAWHSPPSRTVEAASITTISTQDYHFAPSVAIVAVGDSVRWESNNLGGGDISNHTTTSDPGVSPAWNAPLPPPNTSFTMTFTAPGIYTYHCEIHPVSMSGTIIVQDVATASLTSTPTASATPTPTSTPTAVVTPNHAPSVSANWAPSGGPAPLAVSVNWSAFDMDGDMLSATVDWGDGASVAVPLVAPYGPQLNAHTYTLAGAFIAKVTVTDGHSGTGSVAAPVLVGPDGDDDFVPDAYDNCPSAANPSQTNADAVIDNGPGVLGDDTTVPDAVSDAEGDACETDGDADNDGLPDAQDTEPLGAVGICAAFAGSSDGHLYPAGGDVTDDDNRDGSPAPPIGIDGNDSGPSWDTDGDGVLDGVECQLGANPRAAASRPTLAVCGGNADLDADGIPAAAERCKWGTSDTLADSDGDGKSDCVEANDLNGDGVQNFPGDVISSARASSGVIGRTMDFDLNGDGSVNFPGDTVLSAKFVMHVGGICM